MGLPGVFEAYQLAIGPSTVLTTGALRIGQAFRDVLLSSPYNPDYRIIIELSGNFYKSGRENNSDQAVVAGLGGFTPEEPDLALKSFYKRVKEQGWLAFPGYIWPFNPESDLTFSDSETRLRFPNCIRFHLVSQTGQPAFQAEYFVTGTGMIRGTGLPDPKLASSENSPVSFKEIQSVVAREKISLLEYTVSGECSRHRISRDQVNKRMLATWKLMLANIDHGLKAQFNATDMNQPEVAALLKNYLSQLSSNPSAGGEYTRASVYAIALAAEILNNRPVITAPTCMGSAVVPSVLRLFQEKYLFSDEKIVEALMVGGLFGTLILNRLNESDPVPGMQSEIAFSAIMAAAGVSSVMGGTIREIEYAASMAAILYGGTFSKDERFESGKFMLMNSMVAQTLPALADLSRIQADNLVPEFDVSLSGLFSRP